MITKTCNNCKIIKPVDDFNTKPGCNGQRRYNYLCKSCQSDKTKQKNKQIKEASKIIVNEKICNKCQLIKPSNQFTKDIYQITGFSKNCVNCQSQYYKNNKTIFEWLQFKQ